MMLTFEGVEMIFELKDLNKRSSEVGRMASPQRGKAYVCKGPMSGYSMVHQRN